jgi:hypothetical protein
MFPLLSPTTFFLLVINIVYAFFDTFAIVDAATARRSGQGRPTILVYKVYSRRLQGAWTSAARPRSRVVLMVHRDRADGGAVPLRRDEGAATDMVERRPVAGRLLSAPSCCVARACCIVAFPVYLTFVASHADGASRSCRTCRCRCCRATTSRRTTAACSSAGTTTYGARCAVGTDADQQPDHARW